ncbi:MAG TPA: molybdopterin-dependent oxidoreductase [Xanthobacteraceae bacterium]|nr:molybdopterin-dependent oxidoreductase [Xanthobacteraceae bacterium]
MITRRRLFKEAATGAALVGTGLSVPNLLRAAGLDLPQALPEGVRQIAKLDALPGKRPLIKLSYRPPNYETPIEYFRTAITPNDAFFVRYHLSDIPQVDPKTWRLAVGGEAANGQAELTLDDLKALPAAEVVAVNQCSGNRRGLFQPHVPGVEWGYGAMGCARWKGARLKDVLEKAGLKKDAVEIVFEGADGPAVETTPDFVKSIPVWKAMEDTTLVAYEMNGEPLPHFNGFPARIIVPGWTGTYWMKHVTSAKAVSKPWSGYWMNPAYRIPARKFPIVADFSSQETPTTTPITEMVVNSLITSPANGTRVQQGAQVTIGGIAWDAGYGIRSVDISTDSGRSWNEAALGPDLGRFAFRTFSFTFAPRGKGKHTVTARASNTVGQTQTAALIHNPAGYHHNVVHTITIDVA